MELVLNARFLSSQSGISKAGKNWTRFNLLDEADVPFVLFANDEFKGLSVKPQAGEEVTLRLKARSSYDGKNWFLSVSALN